MDNNTNETTENLLMKVGGMQCSFCVESIQKAFRRIDGVSHIGVSLSHEETLVQYDPLKVNPNDLKNTLKSLGYKLRDPNKLISFEEEERELKDQKRLLLTALLISGISLIFMTLTWINLQQPWFPLIMLTLTLIMIFGVARDILKMAFASLRRRIYNQHVLMEFGAFGGLIGGLLGFFIQPWPMSDFMGAAIFITAYHILSGYVSLLVTTKSSQAIRKLMDLQPSSARVIKNGIEKEIPVEEIKINDLIIVRPGESIPVDGIVIEGNSSVDQSLVTGEPIPISANLDDEVIGGSINQFGKLVIKTTKIGDDSFLQQIMRSIEESRALKPSILQIVEKVLKYFVPGVLISAGFAFLLWTVGAWLLTGEIQFTTAILSTLAVLVMGYPCALGMATPLAMIRGGGIAAQHGILMRSGEALQVFKDVNIVALDKTGTLTEGKPKVVFVKSLNPIKNDNELISITAALEQYSEHALAKAILDYAKSKNIPLLKEKITDFQALPGLGVKGFLGSQSILIGSPSFIYQKGISLGSDQLLIQTMENEGKTVICVTKNSELVGIVAIADTLKSDTISAIERMKSIGLEPIMITGDNKRTANTIAKQIGIKTVFAQVLPQEKSLQIRHLQNQGNTVAMVGDGINDTPALMQADVGIAIGAGTDIALETADIILVNNNLTNVVDAYIIGKKSYSKTRQNVILAFMFNGVGIPLAVVGLLHPVFAMIAMATSVTTILLNSFNGFLLKNKRLPQKKKEAKEPQSLILSIPTIKCQGCVDTLKDSLKNVTGVNTVEGNPENKTLTLVLDSNRVSEDKIESIINKKGHKVGNKQLNEVTL